MQKGHQPVWNEILNHRPDLLLLLGDNVYAKKGIFSKKILEERYKLQCDEPNFSRLLKKVPYIPIWDNHDLGIYNPQFGFDVSSEHKNEARSLFDKYLKKGSIVPNTPEVYCSCIINNIKFIMLDVRSYQQNPNSCSSSLLGKKQEKWLIKELNHNNKFTIVCSGNSLSFGSNDNWLKYPIWFENFTTKFNIAPNPLFLAGSIHRNRIIIHPKHNFYEIISSSVGRNDSNKNPINNYGMLTFTNHRLDIRLYGHKPSNNISKSINLETWKLNPC